MILNDSTASLSITVQYLFYLGRDIGYALDTTLPCFALTQFISRLTDMVNLKCFSEEKKFTYSYFQFTGQRLPNFGHF